MPGTQQSLSILTTAEGQAMLAERFDGVIENLQKSLKSIGLKNTDLSGDPDSGSVVAKRFANATSQPYGTARAAGAGNKVKEGDVVIEIDTDREIIEEVEAKDVQLGDVKDLIARRTMNHPVVMQAEFDKKFFAVAAADGTTVDVHSYSTIEEKIEALIQECENTKNQFVDGVDRGLMALTTDTSVYGKIRTALDKATRPGVDAQEEEFYAYHGVKTDSCVNLPAGVKAILMVPGAVAQPALIDPYGANKLQLSEAYSIELFYHYGTKSVTPDLIFVIHEYIYTEVTGSYVSGTTYYTKNSSGAYVEATGISAFAANTTYYTRAAGY